MGIIDDNWYYEIDIDQYVQKSQNLFETEIKCINENVLEALQCAFVNVFEDKAFLPRSSDDELKSLMENNRELKQEIENKVKELSKQQTQYEILKQDQILLKQEVKETHEAFLMARKHYKKCLNIYYSIEAKSNETQTVYVQFFTELKRIGGHFSVNLLRNTKSSQYTLQSINPTIKCYKELQRKLQETNDIPGMLCWIRQAFLTLKTKEDM